jgi:threonine/homoserine/homoserine lactone efflux protein
VPFGLLTAFWIVSVSLVMVPGADWAYAISAGMRERAITPAVGGMLLGYLAITVAVALGVGALVESTPAILTVLTFAGAGYLIWLGVGVLARPSMPTAGVDHASSVKGWLMRGFAVSGMNPKALLLFLALLPQFTSPRATWPISEQIGALGLVQIVNCALVYSAVAVGSKVVLRTRPGVARVVTRISGFAMIAIALLLLIERLLVLLR